MSPSDGASHDGKVKARPCATVKKALEALGVGVNAAVNLDAKTVEVSGETDAAKVAQAIAAAGYAVRERAT
jgi:copper chaperone CopZ